MTERSQDRASGHRGGRVIDTTQEARGGDAECPERKEIAVRQRPCSPAPSPTTGGGAEDLFVYREEWEALKAEAAETDRYKALAGELARAIDLELIATAPESSERLEAALARYHAAATQQEDQG